MKSFITLLIKSSSCQVWTGVENKQVSHCLVHPMSSDGTGMVRNELEEAEEEEEGIDNYRREAEVSLESA